MAGWGPSNGSVLHGTMQTLGHGEYIIFILRPASRSNLKTLKVRKERERDSTRVMGRAAI